MRRLALREESRGCRRGEARRPRTADVGDPVLDYALYRLRSAELIEEAARVRLVRRAEHRRADAGRQRPGQEPDGRPNPPPHATAA
ncbi:hypothetical protein Sdia_51660 [Streptomyces diastaticus subsp. diastaticus]|uniref:DUF3263 domain-containing protein n=1 Tax=Streptomyces diastaticus subsp. diastaticus TaxID=68040 RepID=A0ABQ1CW24_STRDI|nr:hypothetical protein [Streptomyces sp. SID8455]GFH74398.1 hypothetical protein Sdia_51660 [Streptomyces diastaticus subsp. diastaticus]GGU02700.1 hypothetical protein GCM10015534_00370 [Streptomyces diastaticus subsp. diastaticus]